MTVAIWLWIGLAIAMIGLIIAAVEITIGVFRSMKRDPTCAAFCPGCKSDLVMNGNYIGETDRGLSYFECRACRVESFWDFYAPLPILIKPLPPEEKNAS